MKISTSGYTHILPGNQTALSQATGPIQQQNTVDLNLVNPRVKNISGNQSAVPSGPGPKTTPKNQPSPVQSTDRSFTGKALSQSELQLVEQLKKADTAVRQHEMAHIAAGGSLITSGANFSYKRGPDGKSYAVAGEVGIDTAPIPGDPEATIQKMKQVKRSALAPANPSAQDLRVASKAVSIESKAQSDLMMIQAKMQAETKDAISIGNPKAASKAYLKTDNLPETDTSTFQIAV